MTHGDEHARRQAAISQIWRYLELDPRAVTAPVWLAADDLPETRLFQAWSVSEGGLFDEDDYTGDVESLEDAAVESVCLIHAAYFCDDVWAHAYDLGDGFYYVTTDNGYDGASLDVVTPKALAEEVFTKVEKAWIWSYWAQGGIPHGGLTALHADEPWFLRELTLATMKDREGEEILWGRIWERQNLFGRARDEIDVTADEVARVWQRAVTPPEAADPGAAPPGLAAKDPDHPEFLRWLNHTSVRWRDTGEPLDVETARVLRLVCQYFGR